MDQFMMRYEEEIPWDHFDDNFNGMVMFFHARMQHQRHRSGDRWANASGKSGTAIRREMEAKSKFDYLQSQMELALYENTMTMIVLATHPKESNVSPLKLLSSDVIAHVLEFVGCTKSKGAKSASAGRAQDSLAIVPFVGWKNNKSAPNDAPLNLADLSVYQPGCKIVIPLAKPNLHLTGPCYRDLRKHIKTHANWDVQRIAATPQEEREFRAQQGRRKGKVYFINAIYKVPGKAVAAKRKRNTDRLPATSSLAPHGMTAAAFSGNTRKSPPESLISPETQSDATVALRAVLQSAANDENGNVAPEVFQRALDAGYSRHFINGKVYLDSIKDDKPPAKKKTRTNNQK